MSDETRTVIIDAAKNLGEKFISWERAKGSGEFDICQEAKELYQDEIGICATRIAHAANVDPNRADSFLRPAIFTRLDAYLKVDGLPEQDRKQIRRLIRSATVSL
jgi:hypothetical protein